MFSFLCLLSFDVYVKKMLLERVLDDLGGKEARPAEKAEKKKSEKRPGN